MKKSVWFAMSVVGMCTAAILSAQQQAPAPSPQTSAPSPASTDRVMITGCVARATPSPTGTSGAAAGAAAAIPDDTKFMLTNASSGDKATSTAGTSGSTASASTAAQYRLDGSDAQLTSHVGHKVEITGMITERASASSSASGASAASAATGPKLKVDAVKMISQTCP